MKRILLVVLVVCLLAGQASAAMYVMDAATAIDLRKVISYNANVADLEWVGYNDGTAWPTSQAGIRVDGSGDYDEGMYYQVGFRGDLLTSSGLPSMDIGAAGNTNGVLDALQDLGSFDSYGLHIANDSGNTWEYKLYAEFLMPVTYYRSTGWTSLDPGTQTFLTLDLGGESFEDNVLIDIGFDIQATQALDWDGFHTSVVPVPAAVILGILGLGAVGLKLRRFA